MQKKYNYSFKEFVEFYCINTEKALLILDVHRTTYTRWLTGETIPPPAVFELLRLHSTGEPPHTNNTWRYWRFQDNYLICTSYRRKYTPSDILMIPTYEQMARELKEIKANYALQSKLF